MKNRFFLAMLCLMLLTLTACGGENVSPPTQDNPPAVSATDGLPAPKTVWSVTEDITISLSQSTYPVGTEHFTVTLKNTGEETMLYGGDYRFQYYDGTDWQDCATIEGYGFDSMGYLLFPGDTAALDIGTWLLAQPLQEGRCRIVGCTLRLAGNADELSFDGDYTDYPPYELEFDISKDARPETDVSALFSLEIGSVDSDGATLPLTFQNDSGSDAQILLIPTLEWKNEFGNWEFYLYREDIGFCGTPDLLPVGSKEWSVNLYELWGDLPANDYRLSYTVTAPDGREVVISGEFALKAALCGYPLAEDMK